MKRLKNIRVTLLLTLLLLALLGLTAVSCAPSGSPEVTYQVTVQMNYRGGGSQTLSMTSSDSYSVPDRTGYDFLGLFTEPSGGSMVYNAFGSCQILLEKNMTVYAQWAPKTYRITFDGRDVAVPDGYKTLEVTYDSELSAFPTLEKEGYIFEGWEDSEGNLYSNGAEIMSAKKVFNAENYAIGDDADYMTLYARFTVKKYTVTLDYNDGTYRTETLEVDHGKPLTEEQRPAEDTGSSRIVAWTAMAGSTEDFRGVVTQNMTLYAVWREYRVTTLNDTSGQEYKVEIFKDEPLDLTTYNGVTLPGYELEGWYTSPTYGGNPVTEITYATAEQTYYAKWKVATYTIIFDCSPTGQRLDPITYQMGDTNELPGLSLTGYTFNGWLTEKEGKNPIRSLPADLYGDRTLYASLTANEYTLSLDNGKTVTVRYQTAFTLPVPVREGYNFTGWFIDGTALTDQDGKSLAGYGYTEDHRVQAGWEIKKYTVTFESNGGTKVDSITVEHNAYLPMPAEPTKDGVILDGWYDQELTTPYTSSTRVTSAMTLYAKWIVSNPISSVEDLMNIKNAPSENYHLVCDIDLKGGAISGIGNIEGLLDGKGFCIKNFVFDVGGSSTALIGTNNGIIRNLILKDFVYKSNGSENVNRGVLVRDNNGRIENCHIKDGVISSSDNSALKEWGSKQRYAGVIACKNAGIIESCTVDADITVYNRGRLFSDFSPGDRESAVTYFGIIVGESTGTVNNCHTSGKVTIITVLVKDSDRDTVSGGTLFGGIVSRNHGKMEYCSSDAEIVVSNGSYLAVNYIGGLVQHNEGPLQYCSSNVTVTLEANSVGKYASVGGIAQYNNNTISNCFSTATIHIPEQEMNPAIMCGVFIHENNGTITNCYTAGSIHSDHANVEAGGFVHYNNGIISKSLSFSDVITTSGKKIGFFTASTGSNSTLSNCLYSTGATITGSATGTLNTEGNPESFATLTAPGFLIDELSWDAGIWEIKEGALPTLK